jgi:hypothetical protein
MGSKQSNAQGGSKDKDFGKYTPNPTALIAKNNFDFMYVVGRGGFGKVTIPQNNRSGMESILQKIQKGIRS